MENSSFDEVGECNAITSPEDVEDEKVLNRERAKVKKRKKKCK